MNPLCAAQVLCRRYREGCCSHYKVAGSVFAGIPADQALRRHLNAADSGAFCTNAGVSINLECQPTNTHLTNYYVPEVCTIPTDLYITRLNVLCSMNMSNYGRITRCNFLFGLCDIQTQTSMKLIVTQRLFVRVRGSLRLAEMHFDAVLNT